MRQTATDFRLYGNSVMSTFDVLFREAKRQGDIELATRYLNLAINERSIRMSIYKFLTTN